MDIENKYVAGIMADDQNPDKLLLIEKLKPSWQSGLLNAVGGKFKEGESSFEAMVREFREETSIETKPEDWVLFGIIGGSDFKVYFFKSKGAVNSAKQATLERPVVVDIRDPSLPDRCVDNLMPMLHASQLKGPVFIEMSYS